MSIQGNVNQIISLTALLASQNPAVKAMGEKRQQTRQLKAEEKAIAKREAVAGEVGPEREEDILGLVQDKADLARRKYKLDPTVETFKAQEKAYREVADLERTIEGGKPSGVVIDGRELTNAEAAELAEQSELRDDYIASQQADEKMENWETFEKKAQEADAHTLEAQNAKRAAIQRKKGFTKQSYGRSGITAGRSGKATISFNKGGNE